LKIEFAVLTMTLLKFGVKDGRQRAPSAASRTSDDAVFSKVDPNRKAPGNGSKVVLTPGGSKFERRGTLTCRRTVDKIRVMSNQARIWSAGFIAGVALSAIASLSAAEKVQLRGSTAVELPKPNRAIDESSRFKFDNSSTMDAATGFLPPPSSGSNGALDRKLKEMMDRKKNWIFENPYDRKMDGRSAEILDNEGNSSPLLEHRLLKDESKTAMQRFLEEKESQRTRGENPNANNNGPAGAPENRPEKTDLASQNGPNSGDGKPEDKPAALFFGSENSFFKERESSFDSGTFQKKMERSPLDGGVFGQNRFAETPKPERDTFQREDARQTEFNSMIQSRGAVSVASPTADTRLEAAFNPAIGPARPEIGARPTDFSGGGTRVDFGGGRIGSLSSTLPSSSEIGGLDNSFTKSPTYSPSSAPTSFAPPPQQQPRPFVFELPRRKF
jgi:hypothetical protein